jgi:hypothetical protein
MHVMLFVIYFIFYFCSCEDNNDIVVFFLLDRHPLLVVWSYKSTWRDNKQCVCHHFFSCCCEEFDNNTRHPPLLVVWSYRNAGRDNEQCTHRTTLCHSFSIVALSSLVWSCRSEGRDGEQRMTCHFFFLKLL